MYNKVARYNIDNTVDVYPVFSQKRWVRYRQLKERLESKKDEIKTMDLAADLFGVPKKEVVIEIGKNVTIQNELKAEMYKIHKPRKINNKKEDGFQLNTKAQKKVKSIMLLLQQKFKKNYRGKRIGFYTFTCTPPNFKYDPTKHDSLVTRQFQKMLENLKKHHGLDYYVYVAERQDGKRLPSGKEATNRIHYHAVFYWKNEPPHVQQVNYYWLQLLADINFTTFNKEKLFEFVNTRQNVSYHLNKYYKAILNNDIREYYPFRGMSYSWQTIKENLNIRERNPLNNILFQPVDVQNVSSHSKLAIYLAKYVCKSEDKIYSRVWGATRKLLSFVGEVVIREVYKITEAVTPYIKKWWDKKAKKEKIGHYENEIPIRIGGVEHFLTYTKFILNDEAFMNGIFSKYRKQLMADFDKHLIT